VELSTLLNEVIPGEPVDLRDLRFVGMDDGPVPDFRVQSTDGRVFDSTELVGAEAFVIVFFATWCPICNEELDGVRRALDRVGRVVVIGVSADPPETFPRVGAYLRERGLAMPVVRASRYPRFALSYNPFETVPLVVVVGRNGGLVDFEIGDAVDEARMVDAVELARRIGPLAPPT
jgi:thiol-disulfide isomerase/thioredoxin